MYWLEVLVLENGEDGLVEAGVGQDASWESLHTERLLLRFLLVFGGVFKVVEVSCQVEHPPDQWGGLQGLIHPTHLELVEGEPSLLIGVELVQD